MSIKMIGVCFGHQILAEALWGKVVKNNLGWEIGWTELTLSTDGSSFLKSDDKRFIRMHEMHQDHVIKTPPGFTILASTNISENQIMMKQGRFLGIQAHPEYHAGIVHEFIKYVEYVALCFNVI